LIGLRGFVDREGMNLNAPGQGVRVPFSAGRQCGVKHAAAPCFELSYRLELDEMSTHRFQGVDVMKRALLLLPTLLTAAAMPRPPTPSHHWI
jgi:hypothetical protein